MAVKPSTNDDTFERFRDAVASTKPTPDQLISTLLELCFEAGFSLEQVEGAVLRWSARFAVIDAEVQCYGDGARVFSEKAATAYRLVERDTRAQILREGKSS